MTRTAQWTAVDDYITDLLVQPDAALEAVQAAAHAAGLPPISVAPNQGKLLQLFVRMIGAKRVLEIGTLAGYSTIWLARGMAEGGQVVTLELETRHAEVARANFVRAGVLAMIDLRVGRASDSLADLTAERGAPFDLVFIDADKANIPDYFAAALRLSRVGSVIVVDNVVRDGALIDAASSDPNVVGVRRLHEMLSVEPRVSATTIQTVGSKGYDGLTVAVVVG